MPRYEYIAGSSAKFWEVTVDGCDVTTHWGRIGTKGQSKTKTLASPAAARSEADKQTRKKQKKGYVEAGSGQTSSANTSPADGGRTSGDLADGEETTVQGSSGRSYTLKNTGGVYSCSCPAWLHQSIPIEERTCKHLRAFRGDAAEEARLGSLPARSTRESGVKPGAPAVLLAHSWDPRDPTHDPTDWWWSEKLDGVRAWWDGETFLSRRGNRFVAPDWFTRGLPDQPLDGELFGGRKQFQRTVSIARRVDAGDAWKQLEFVVFDAPEHDGPFEERLEAARGLLDGHRWARVLEHQRCGGVEDLERRLRGVEALGGEGVMLRKPGSAYAAGRSFTLLKVKTFHDAEATVVGHLPGTGRHSGRLGALEVELVDGTRFKVGTGFKDAERDDPPPVGSVITFRYQELTRDGVPRFPSFLRVCEPE